MKALSEDCLGPVKHVQGYQGGQGVLLEARWALAAPFWTKFGKQKLLGPNSLLGMDQQDRVLELYPSVHQPDHNPREVLQPWSLGLLVPDFANMLATWK